MFYSYVFSTVQRYGDFRTPTIPPLGHFIYHQYGINPNPLATTASHCASAPCRKFASHCASAPRRKSASHWGLVLT